MPKSTLKVAPGFVFMAKNFHCVACGKPPNIKAKSVFQTSYFENALGEQMVYVYDRKSDAALLYHGDAEWDPPHMVDLDAAKCDVVLDADEKLWLKACIVCSRVIRAANA